MIVHAFLLSLLLLIFTWIARWGSKDDENANAKKLDEGFPRMGFVPSMPTQVDAYMPIPNTRVDEFMSVPARVRVDEKVAAKGTYKCAACFATATTRCSRCKAVRYCSSKCQIIHWRQGHKHECHPQVPGEFEREDPSGKVEPKEQFKTDGVDSAEVLPKRNKGNVDQTNFDNSDSHILMPRLSTVTIDSSDNTVRPSPPIEPKGHVLDSKSRYVVQKERSNTSDVVTSFKPSDSGHSEKKMNKERLRRSSTAKSSTSNPSPGIRKYNSFGGDEFGDLHRSEPKEVPDVKLSHSIKRGEDKELANKHFDTAVSLTRGGSSSNYLVHSGIKSSLKKVVQQLKPTSQKKTPLESNSVGALGSSDVKVAFHRDIFMKLYASKVELKPFGLVNCGNSCYANAVLQCLIFTRPLTTYLLQGVHSRGCEREVWCFICEFEHLVSKGSKGNTPLSPVRILSKISHLGHGRQEDAHEFLRYVVDTMQSICIEQVGFAGPVAEETTLIGMTFGGYLHSKIKCMRCHHKSEKYEKMMDLTVEIDGDIRTLEQALKRFTASEILESENRYYCSRCKSYEKAKKKMTVSQAPNILTIVLKRFKAGNFTKLNKHVRFPEILNMTPYMSGLYDISHQYTLYAVVVHLDVNDALSGHYVCYVKSYREWFKIDDSVVISVDLKRVLSEEAYILLYARDSPRLPASTSKGGERNLEAIPRQMSEKSGIPKPRRHSADISADPLVIQHQPSRNGQLRNPAYLEDWVTQSVESIPLIDSSSETSSTMFSPSEEGTCSTPSTKDSASIEDFSDYLFGRGTSRP